MFIKREQCQPSLSSIRHAIAELNFIIYSIVQTIHTWHMGLINRVNISSDIIAYKCVISSIQAFLEITKFYFIFRQMERIIDHMYEEIHGPIPETPNGSSDTPRMRNRRRRNEIASGSQTKCADGIASSSDLHYDASSEWVASDKSEDDEPIITSEIGVRPDRPERTAASANFERSSVHFVQARDVQSAQLPCDNRDVFSEQLSCGPERSQSSPFMDRDECNWPFLDQYREELLERVKSSPTGKFMCVSFGLRYQKTCFQSF